MLLLLRSNDAAAQTVAISIKERILRQMRTNMAAVTGAAAAYRFSARGRWHNGSAFIDRLERDSIIVICQSDDVIEQALGGNQAPVTKRMRVVCGTVLMPDDDATTSHDTLMRRWEALMENKARATRFVFEGSVQLAIEARVVDVPDAAVEQGQREFVPAVYVQVEYMHDRNDPHKLGTVIATTYEA